MVYLQKAWTPKTTTRKDNNSFVSVQVHSRIQRLRLDGLSRIILITSAIAKHVRRCIKVDSFHQLDRQAVSRSPSLPALSPIQDGQRLECPICTPIGIRHISLVLLYSKMGAHYYQKKIFRWFQCLGWTSFVWNNQAGRHRTNEIAT